MAAGKGRRLWVMVVKEEVRRKMSGEVVMMVRGSSSEEVVVKGRSQRIEVGENTQGAPPSQVGFPWQGGFRPGEQPQGAGAGECREGDSLALGLRPGSFDSSQN